ncbi:uncharacterized protein LOC126882012 [Diabrotica virgifera virgifera]|uniref:HTH psq-type domain-containing protein n=1 Tax=Diabrotica virgifera virgifera TaxID=50390 RepID=A0ABM5JXS2_DIAVI|nr:uncharacterized protein LOC126882012 [Diabrotica virgifera virgifera]
MVRTYVRKSNQQSWSEESMKNAIDAVREGTLKYKAADTQFNVPPATLFRRLKLDRTSDLAAKKRLGRFRTVFTPEQENELNEHVLDMERHNLFGLTIQNFRHLA